MEQRSNGMMRILALYIFILATNKVIIIDARGLLQMVESKQLKVLKHMDIYMATTSGDHEPHPYGISSPFSLPPLESLPPFPLDDQISPPFCVYPPLTPSRPPPPPNTYNNPQPSTQPPPPPFHFPTPPTKSPVPSPPVFPPPVVHPPPSAPPPPPHKAAPEYALWCVAKAMVPDPIIQEALDYACGSGADCKPIQHNGSCYLPNTLIAHASYAFNSYWQRTKVAGGTCDFGRTAMLVTVDPSYGGCLFIYN